MLVLVISTSIKMKKFAHLVEPMTLIRPRPIHTVKRNLKKKNFFHCLYYFIDFE